MKPLRIDCSTCPVAGIHCDTCMVTALVALPLPVARPAGSSDLELDDADHEVVHRFLAAGLLSAQGAGKVRVLAEPGWRATG